MDTKGKVIDVLKKLGLMLFEDDDRVCFFYQMTLYLYVPDSNDPEFLAIYIPSFYEVDEDDDELEVMKVMNECTSFMKVTKLQLEKEYVSVACELFVSEDSDLEDIVKRCIVTLHQTKERFEKEMKGL